MNRSDGVPSPVFAHLARLTDRRGLFEHAKLSDPRREHGYCVDDAARALVVVCRQPLPNRSLQRLASRYLDFVVQAVGDDGACHNRMDVTGNWTDTASLGDWWGRALWGLGTAATRASTRGMRARALAAFRIAAQPRSPFNRAMAFAALGAGEVLRARPDELSARTLLGDAGRAVGPVHASASWPWPEPRLRYANATVAEAMLTAGATLGDEQLLADGLMLLDFLLSVETRDGHLSVTPVGGRGPDDTAPGFDQQPIEVAALTDALATALAITGDPRWRAGISMAWNWFQGENDSATPMFDPSTGAGYDGLEAHGRNLNQGAESTLAMLSTAQHARSLRRAG